MAKKSTMKDDPRPSVKRKTRTDRAIDLYRNYMTNESKTKRAKKAPRYKVGK